MATQATFTRGSTMRHVVVMTTVASVGLMTLFVVDLVDMYFLSLLGETELAAAVGYAGTILFFTTSISIGIAIATGALVSQALGRQQRVKARRYAVNAFAYGIVVALASSVVVWIWIPVFLKWLGATGSAHALAAQYLRIIIPSMVILVVAMAASGVLRATGDAKRSMYAIVSGGVVNAVLDPILIFGLEMGIRGAAWASVFGRICVMAVALYGVVRIHNLLGRFRLSRFFVDLAPISRIAIPAILTNVATPIGNAYVVAAISGFGDSAVAGMSIIGRLIPVAFGVVFALSGAVGPIIGQNFGAGQLDRVRQSVKDALSFSAITVISVCAVLYLLQNPIIRSFSASGDAATLISLFATWIAFSFLFNAAQFIANAAFNNLGYPHYSTLFNFAKATLGTIPFVYVGALVAGAPGILIGQAIGTVLTGIAALWICFRVIARCQTSEGVIAGPGKKPFNLRIPLWPQSNIRG